MSEPTLYRLICDSATHEIEHQNPPDTIVPTNCHDWHPDLVGFEPVEPTDRICRPHNYWMDTAETICDVRWMDDRQTECDTFDVVRIGDSE